MKDFFTANWLTIVILSALFVTVIYLAFTRQWTKLRELAYKLMLSAERLYEENQGREKFEAVFKKVYNLIPAWLKYFIPEVTIKVKLQKWYEHAKDSLDDGYINNSI